jgi:tetraacyldisaccharide 4'-kinase
MRVAAIAGIGNPARFFVHLRALGIGFAAHEFPDHHRYSVEELQCIEADAILMTEKDAIKCASFADARMWAVPVAAVTSDELLRLVLDRIAAASLQAPAARRAETRSV